jgi:hypothetical protein
MVAGASAASRSREGCGRPREMGPEFEEPHGPFTHEREEAHAQDWDLGLDLDTYSEKEREKRVCPARPIPVGVSDRTDSGIRHPQLQHRSVEKTGREHDSTGRAADELIEIYEAERGELPAAGALTPERRSRCERWLALGFTPEQFRAAVRCAAATPFLTGDGSRGWQASFDWLIANRSNLRKVLEGEYAPQGPPRARQVRASSARPGPADLYTGAAPRPADCGVRVNPAALARIRAREAQRAGDDLAAARAPYLAPKPAAFDTRSRAAPVAR